MDGIRLAQKHWAAAPPRLRARLMGQLRRRIASGARELAEAVPTHLPGALHRTVADTLVAEVLPLAEACRFLEKEAAWILRRKVLGAEGRPLWLGCRLWPPATPYCGSPRRARKPWLSPCACC
jgi:aldehyde dehydrogenase (NAD+)